MRILAVAHLLYFMLAPALNEATPGAEDGLAIGGNEAPPGPEDGLAIGGNEATPGPEDGLAIGGNEATPGPEDGLAPGGNEAPPGAEDGLAIGGNEAPPGPEDGLAIGGNDAIGGDAAPPGPEDELAEVRACFDHSMDANRLRKLKALVERPVEVEEATFLSTRNNESVVLAGSGAEHFTQGQFGTCAMLGNGPSLTGRGLGEEIDLHDTVIRFAAARKSNMSVRDYGKRTDVLVRRTCDFGVDEYARNRGFFQSHNVSVALSAGALGGRREKKLKAYLTAAKFCKTHGKKKREYRLSEDKIANPFRHTNGVPILYWDCLNTVWRTCKTSVAEGFYSKCAAKHHHHPKKPTSGWKAAMFLTFSGLCQSLTIYGFSASGTAKTKYWEFAHASSDGTIGKPFVYGKGTEQMAKEARDVTHSLDLEYEWWQALMRTGNATGSSVNFDEPPPPPPAPPAPPPERIPMFRRLGTRMPRGWQSAQIAIAKAVAALATPLLCSLSFVGGILVSHYRMTIWATMPKQVRSMIMKLRQIL